MPGDKNTLFMYKTLVQKCVKFTTICVYKALKRQKYILCFRNGFVEVRNNKLNQLKVDHLYHIALDTEQHDLQSMFGDVKVWMNLSR